MSSFLHSIASVAIILLLTAAGYYCGHRGYINNAGKGMLSKILLRLCIPCMVISNFQSSFTKASLKEAGRGVWASFTIMATLMLLSLLVARLLKLERKQIGVFITLAGLSNAMFVGYPMCVQLFGEQSIPYIMVFYLATTTLLQTIGCGAIRFSGGSGKLFSQEMGKKLLTTPAILAIFAAFALLMLDIRLPSFLLSTLKYLSNCVTPIALLITGYIMYSIGLKSLRMDKTLAVGMFIRFILSPAVALLICRLFGVEGLLRNVIVVESAMPCPSQTAVFASEYGADEELAARGCSLSTLLSFAEIPLIMLVLNAL